MSAQLQGDQPPPDLWLGKLPAKPKNPPCCSPSSGHPTSNLAPFLPRAAEHTP